MDVVKFSRGLWMLWKDAKIRVKVIGITDQSIFVYVDDGSQKPWLFIVVYASPCFTRRAKLWEYLNFVANCHQLP